MRAYFRDDTLRVHEAATIGAIQAHVASIHPALALGQFRIWSGGAAATDAQDDDDDHDQESEPVLPDGMSPAVVTVPCLGTRADDVMPLLFRDTPRLHLVAQQLNRRSIYPQHRLAFYLDARIDTGFRRNLDPPSIGFKVAFRHTRLAQSTRAMMDQLCARLNDREVHPLPSAPLPPALFRPTARWHSEFNVAHDQIELNLSPATQVFVHLTELAGAERTDLLTRLAQSGRAWRIKIECAPAVVSRELCTLAVLALHL